MKGVQSAEAVFSGVAGEQRLGLDVVHFEESVGDELPRDGAGGDGTEKPVRLSGGHCACSNLYDRSGS